MTDNQTVVAEDVGAAVGPDTATDKEAEKSDVTAEEAAAEDASPDHSHECVEANNLEPNKVMVETLTGARDDPEESVFGFSSDVWPNFASIFL